MHRIAAGLLLTTSLVLSGCGTSAVTSNITGTWNATLNSSGNETFGFVTNLTVNSDGSLGTSSLNITVNNLPACSFPTVTETGTFTITGNFNGQVSGNFHYVIKSTGTTISTLTLDGTVRNGQITGTWTVTGTTAGCSGNGTFTMIPMPGA